MLLTSTNPFKTFPLPPKDNFLLAYFSLNKDTFENEQKCLMYFDQLRRKEEKVGWDKNVSKSVKKGFTDQPDLFNFSLLKSAEKLILEMEIKVCAPKWNDCKSSPNSECSFKPVTTS